MNSPETPHQGSVGRVVGLFRDWDYFRVADIQKLWRGNSNQNVKCDRFYG
jgi:hypothetical protein